MPQPDKALLDRVRESLSGTYDLLGELGTDEGGDVLYLARDLSSQSLVGLAIKQDDAAGTQFTVEVKRRLGVTVNVQGSTCPECNTPLPDLERFCFQCGADLSGVLSGEGTTESTRLLNAVAAATVGRYEMLGRMDSDGGDAADGSARLADRNARGGMVVFARELSTDKIVALRLRKALPGEAASAEYVVKHTSVFAVPDAARRRSPGDAAYSSAAASQVSPEAARASAGAVGGGVASHAGAGGGVGATDGGGYDAGRGMASGAGTGAADETRSSVQPLPAWVRSPVVVLGALILLAGIGYAALSGDGAGGAGDPAAASDSATAAGAAPAAGATTGGANADRIRTDSIALAAALAADSSAADSAARAATLAGVAPDSGTVRIASTLPTGARVTADGRTVRGRSVRLPAGNHTFTVAADGFESFSQRVRVRPGADVQFAPQLVAIVVASNPNPQTTIASDANKPRAVPTCRETMRQQDWGAALPLCTAEANAGDASAAASVGRLYSRGLGTRADAGQAYSWNFKAALSGDREAQTAVGYALREGSGTGRNASESVRWFKQAAEAGERTAQLEYGVALEKGDGVSRDDRSAREWYRKAADQGNFMAARRLARMFEKGDGGDRSDASAATFYERAASLGDAESALTIGKWYRDGKGVAKSDSQALVWFRKAQELGNRAAAEEIRKLDRGTGAI